MREEPRRNEMTLRPVVHHVPGMDAVTIQRNVQYRAAATGVQTLDLYHPRDAAAGVHKPAVVFVSGYPDAGFEAMLGCKLKDVEQYVSWGRLVAASGMVGVTYTNHEPVADLAALLAYLRDHAPSLGIDRNRIGLWAGSGNVPAALSMLMQQERIAQCAALCYGFMLDLDGSTTVARAATEFKFVNPSAGTSIEDLPADLPLFVARAGQDAFPGLNPSIDAFVAAALARNLPLTLVNHSTGPHAFDILDDSDASREVIRATLAFLRFHLRA